MKDFLFLLFLSICSSAFSQQTDTIIPLKIVGKLDYRAEVAANKDNKLVEIKKEIPGIQLDIRYATTDNFMKEVMYKQARAFARKPVVAQLKLIQKELKKQGLGLKIYDAYRPYAVTVEFYKKATDKAFVANPARGSKHNRGCAVDLSIIDLKSGKEIDMPTPYDSFSPHAAAKYEQLPANIIKNRTLLIDIMRAHGFRVIPNEWWHFDFIGWDKYSLLDIPFEQL